MLTRKEIGTVATLLGIAVGGMIVGFLLAKAH